VRHKYFQWLFVVMMFLSIAYASTERFWAQKGIMLSEAWQYYENQYLSPQDVSDGFDEEVDIPALQGDLLNWQNERKRGSLYKEVELPRQWVGETLVFYQRAFKENLKIYIDDQVISSQGSFTVEGSTSFINDYKALSYFTAHERVIHILIQYDQNDKNVIQPEQILVMPASEMMKKQYILTVIEILGIMLCVLGGVQMLVTPHSYVHWRELLVLFGLIILRWLTVSASPFATLLPISVEFWSKLSYMTHILMSFYMMMLLFERRGIWEHRTNIIMALYTFFLLFNVLLLSNIIHMKLILVVHTVIIVSIYMIKYKAWIKAGSIGHLIILNSLLLCDVLYLFDRLVLPLHLFLFMLYVVYWYHDQSDGKCAVAEILAENPAVSQENISSAVNDNTFAMLFNHADVGVVSVNENLMLDQHYSAYARELLSLSDEVISMPMLLYPNDIERRAYVTEMLRQLFKAKTIEEKEVYLELIPKTAFHRKKHLSLKYAWSEEGQCLVITLSDVTEFVLLEKRLASDEAQLEMILEVLRHQDDFLAIEEDYRTFAKIVENQLLTENSAILDLYHMTLDKIHYFKLQFGRFKLSHFVERLEQIEHDLKSFQTQHHAMALDDLKAMLASYDFEQILNDHITSILPFITAEKKEEKDWYINKVQFEKMLHVIEKLPDDDRKRQLLECVSHVRHFGFKKALENYNRYIEDFSRSIGKKMHPLRVVGEDILVSRERYILFSKACLEIIHNAILYGIERPEERLRQGKSEYGEIRVGLSYSDKIVAIEVSDDGKGFDIQALKATLIDAYPNSFEKISALSDREVIALFTGAVMIEGIEVSMLSSGLRSLRKEILSLDGTMEIECVKQRGTTLYIKLPNNEHYTA